MSSSSPSGKSVGVVDGAAEDMDVGGAELDANKNEKMFTLKKWNAVAMWSWDVECDTVIFILLLFYFSVILIFVNPPQCAICRVQVMGEFFSIYYFVEMACFRFHFSLWEYFIRIICLTFIYRKLRKTRYIIIIK